MAAPDLDWAGSPTTVRGAVQAIPRANPDVVLVDLGLPDASGLDVVRSVRRTCPQAEIMVVSVFGDERSLMAAIRAGATGYLLKDTYTVDFVSAIRDVRAGQSTISPTLARYLLAARRPAERPPAAEGAQEALTDRETEILTAAAEQVLLNGLQAQQPNQILQHLSHAPSLLRKAWRRSWPAARTIIAPLGHQAEPAQDKW